MKTNRAILASTAALALVAMIGCDTEGGSSGNEKDGSTNKPAVVQVAFSLPACASLGGGLQEGAVFSGPAGWLYLSPSCTGANEKQTVWLKVVSDATSSAIDHYVWSIRNWTNAAPNGIFDNYDELVETNNSFKVKTTRNEVRYVSATVAELGALSALFDQQIDVSVVTKDGQVASAYISLKLHNGLASGAQLVFADLAGADAPSQIRFGSFADYYLITNLGVGNVLSMEGDFDTFLALYDTNLTVVATNDDILPGLNLNSQITNALPSGDYYAEATSHSKGVAGSYSINNSTGPLTPVPNPFSSGDNCSSVAGTYAVQELLVLTLTFNGQTTTLTNLANTTVTVGQDGCDFYYRVNDPTGLIPPLLRMGRLNFNQIEVYSDAYLPQSRDLFVTSSGITGSGRAFVSGLSIETSGSFAGTFLSSSSFPGFPFRVDYTSRASFSK